MAAQCDAIANMPVGRRVPKGRRRWYMVHAPRREQAACEKVRRLVSPDLLEDAFVMRKERFRKSGGEWSTSTVPMYEDYFFVVTRDAGALDDALARLNPRMRIARGAGSAPAPVEPEAQAWYERAMDATHTIRTSTAVIVDGQLRIQDGPLVGQEERVVKVDRHHRDCEVRITGSEPAAGSKAGSGGTGAGAGRTERLPMEIPFKS